MQPIRYRLKDMMKAHKYSGPKLADISGIPLGSIRSILSGQSSNPRSTTIEALAKAFNCNIEYLLSEDVPAESINIIEDQISLEDTLFKASIAKVEEITKAKGMLLEGHDDLKRRCVKRIYQYAIEKSQMNGAQAKIDHIYAEWVIEKEWEN